MFGYIRVYEDEMKVRSFRLYKSIYCGLCKTAERRFGFFSKFFLSYDYTFFAAVRMIFTGAEIKTQKKRCGFHLFRKKDVLCENPELKLSAAIFSVLTYYKLLDNIRDEGIIKSLCARLLLPVASGMRKKAVKEGYGEVDLIVSDCMERISQLEVRDNTSTDELSMAFGSMMGHLLKHGLPEKDRNDAYSVGLELGRFIYLADAIDDLYDDEKSGAFNPLLCEFGSAESAMKAAYEGRNALFAGTDLAADILSEKMEALSQDGKRLCEIAQNILYLGCPAVTEGIFRKRAKNKDV